MHVGYEKSHEKKGYKLENGSPWELVAGKRCTFDTFMLKVFECQSLDSLHYSHICPFSSKFTL